jgi:RNA polymerase sigma factor (sigma-70 family)
VDQELTNLIQKARSGDLEAFSTLVSKYKGQVFRHAFSIVNDRMEAEDIAQEAFVKAYSSLSKLDNNFAFVSWLTRIVTNICYDKLKKRQKIQKLQLKSNDRAEQMSMTSSIDRTQLKLEIQEAMQKLSPDQRIVLSLRDIQGYSYDEISKLLSIPLGTVKSRIHSARIALKKEIFGGEQNE